MRILRVPPSRRVWIFDLDNTLHDARPHIFPSMHEQMNAYLQRRFDLDEEGANAHAALLLGALRHHAQAGWCGTMARTRRNSSVETHQFPELASMVVGENALGHALARLGGKRLVFSNAPRHYVEEVLRALGVARWFDAVYTIESTRYRPKPAFQGFRVLLRAHNLEPHRCALIDDMPENLRAAKRLGMSTVWVSGDARRPPFADLRVKSVTELPRLVFRHSH